MAGKVRGWEAIDEALELLRPESKDFWIVIVYAAAVGLLSLSVAVAIQSLVNSIGWGSLLQPIIVLTVLVLVILSLEAVIRLLQVYAIETIYRRFLVRQAGAMMMHLPNLRNDQHSDPSRLANRFFEIMNVQKSLGMVLLDGTALLLQTLIGMALLAFYHPLFLAFDVFLIVTIVIVVRSLFSSTGEAAIQESHSKYLLAGWIEDLARCPQHFRSEASRKFVYEKSDRLLSDHVEARKKYFLGLFKHNVGFNLIYAVASSLLLGIGGYLVIKEQLALGQLVAAELVVTLILSGLAKIAPKLEGIFDLVATTSKIKAFFEQTKIADAGFYMKEPITDGTLALSDINLETASGRHALRNLNLRVSSGEKLLISGHKESGKSSLIECIIGESRPVSGSITLAGHAYYDIPIEKLRGVITWVRFPHLINGSVFEQFQSTNPEVTPGAIRQALADVGAEALIQRLPEGLQTQLNSGGLPLSRAQVVQLAIARAITASPLVLVIDEILDSLDPEARSIILSALTSTDRSWTLICTSQFADLPGNFDRRLRLKSGQLMENPTT
jgi:putative ABC transport system ATP-binding protein